MSYGLSDAGFLRKSYDVIVQEMKERAIMLFGNDINIATNSPLGIFIEDIAYYIASGDTEAQGLWELAENVFFSAYIDTATGIQLDYIGKLIGITRLSAVPSIGQVTFTGVNDSIIPADFLIMTGAGIQFKTITAGVIASGVAIIDIQSVIGGSSANVSSGAITTIVNPTAGINSVINSQPTVGGTDIETDSDFRERYYKSTSQSNGSTADSIRATLLATSAIKSALIITGTGTISAVIYGGTDSDIVQSLFNTVAAGVETLGTTTIPKTDLSGNVHFIRFTRASIINIFINITLTTNSLFPLDGNEQIKNKLIDYISSLEIGDDVIWTKCISKCQEVLGITDLVLTLSTDNMTFVPSNLSITNAQIAKTDAVKIVIT